MAINGTLVLLSADSTAIASTTDATLNIELDTPDAATKDSEGWADHIQGQKSWSVDVEGLATFDYASGNVQQLAQHLIGRTEVDLYFYPNTGSAYFGKATCSSVSIGAPNEDVASISATFTGKGELEQRQES